jgi:hypothetical protein
LNPASLSSRPVAKTLGVASAQPDCLHIKHRRLGGLIHPSDFRRHPSYFSLFVLASISALKFEVTYKKGKSKRGQRIAAMIEGKIMNLSVETKVAIAVATSFVVLIVGAMAQG